MHQMLHKKYNNDIYEWHRRFLLGKEILIEPVYPKNELSTQKYRKVRDFIKI